MGIFSDPCKNPDCSARVKKGASFCSVCGYAGPNSLIECPECHKKIGGPSRFCWCCGADTDQTKAPRIVGDRWVRDEEELAVRINPDDLRGFLSRRVTVEPGTMGLIERQGRITAEKEWGVHTLDRLFALRQASSILLLSAGDLVLRPTFHGLHDKDWADLDVTIQVVLRVKDYEAFVHQFFAGHRRRVTYGSLENAISAELQDVLRALVSAYSLGEMYGNLAWRNEFEAKLRDAMTVTLNRHGLDLLQLNFVDFGGDHYEKIQQDHGEIYMGNHAADHLAEQQAIRRRVAELESQGRLGEFAGEKELADKIDELNSQHHVKSALRAAEREKTIAQARQEFELKKRLRTFEIEDLDGERAKQKQDEQLAREQMLDKITVEHQNEVAMTILISREKRDATQAEFEREQQRLRNEHQLKLAWQQSEQQRANERANVLQRYALMLEESRTSLDTSKNRSVQRLEELKAEEAEVNLRHYDESKKQQLKIEMQQKQAEILRQIQAQELENLKMMKHFQLEEKRLELDLKRYEKEKDTEVQLVTVEGNVRIATSQATIDAAVAREKASQLEERLADHKKDKEALREDADRRARDLRDMADVLSKGSGQPTVVVAGQGGIQQVGGGVHGEAPCPNCNKPVPVHFPNCPYCKHSLMKT